MRAFVWINLFVSTVASDAEWLSITEAPDSPPTIDGRQHLFMLESTSDERKDEGTQVKEEMRRLPSLFQKLTLPLAKWYATMKASWNGNTTDQRSAPDQPSAASCMSAWRSVVDQHMDEASLDINDALLTLQLLTNSMNSFNVDVPNLKDNIFRTSSRINIALSRVRMSLTDASLVDASPEPSPVRDETNSPMMQLQSHSIGSSKVLLTIRANFETSPITIELNAGGHCVRSYKVCCFKNDNIDTLLATLDDEHCGHGGTVHRTLNLRGSSNHRMDRGALFFIIGGNEKMRARELVLLVREVFGGPPNFTLPASWSNDQDVISTIEDSDSNVCGQTVC